MDDRRFDEWTKNVTVAVRSRRAALRLLTGGAGGGLLALLGLREAAACRGFKATCKTTDNCCDGPGFRCRNDKCLCPRAKKYCSPSGNRKAGSCIPKTSCCTTANCTGGQICPQAGQQCCIPQGFGNESVCVDRDDTRCCPGSACRELNANNGFRCRPEGCVEKGGDCSTHPSGCPTACCSFTSSSTTCA